MKSNRKTINFKIFGVPQLQKSLFMYATDKQRATAMRKAGRTAMEYARKYAIMYCPEYNPNNDKTNFSNDNIDAGALKRSISKVRVKYNGVEVTEKMFAKNGKLKTRYKKQLYSYVTVGDMKKGIDYAPRVEWGRNAYLMKIDYDKNGEMKSKYVYIPAAAPQPFMSRAIEETKDKVLNTFGQIYSTMLFKDIIRKMSRQNKMYNSKKVKEFIRQNKIK